MIRLASYLAAAAAAAVLGAGSASAQTVTFSTLPQGSLLNFQSTVMSKVFLDKTDLKVIVTPMRGPEAQIAAVNSNEAQIMLTDASNAAAALNGEEAFAGRPMTKLRAIAKLVTFNIGMLVRKDSKFKTIADLKGARLSAGWTAFKQGERLQEALMNTAGLTMKDVQPVPIPEIIRGADDLKAGRLDSMAIAVGAPKVKEVDSAVGVRFLPVAFNPQNLAAVKKVRADFYLSEVKPSPANTAVLEPMHLLAFDLAFVTNASTPDDTVVKLAKALHENKAELAAGHPSFFGFLTNDMAKQFSVLKYHPAAMKYYQEKGIWPKS